MVCSCTSNLAQLNRLFSDVTTSQIPSSKLQQQYACNLPTAHSSTWHPPTRPQKCSVPCPHLTLSNGSRANRQPVHRLSAVVNYVPLRILVQQAQLRKIVERVQESGRGQLPPRQNRMPKLLALLDQVYEQHGQMDEQRGKVGGTRKVHDSQTPTALVISSPTMVSATEMVDEGMVPDLSLLFGTTGVDSEAAANTEFDAKADDSTQPDAAYQIATGLNNV